MEVCDRVLSTLEAYSVDSVNFQTIYSEGDSIRETMGDVLQTLLIGVLCTMAVIFLFFGDFKASLIVGLSMPLSILLAMICMSYAGFDLDMMTGSALIIAIGMIVDNSIVVMEACMRYRSQGLSPKEAAIQGTSTMVMSILGGTLTTVVVYVPLALVEGIIGQMAGPLCWTIMFCLICSFLCAVVVVPLAYLKLQPRAKEDIPVNRLMGRLQEGYRRAMPKLLRHPGRVVSVGVLCFALAILLLTQMDVIMIPSNYDGSISISAVFRPGTKLEVMDERVAAIATAVFLVFLVMAIQFGSPRLSVMVMMCIPLSLIGSFGLLFLLGRDLSMTVDMAYIVIGGLAASTALAMFLMPAFYLLIRRERMDGTRRGRKAAAVAPSSGD